MPTTQTLALLGGEPLVQDAPEFPMWPPIYDKTAQRLADIYTSRKWSFDGPVEQAFAADFARYHDAKHGIFMANGTVTLQCALAAMGVGPGDEVIVPSLTWLATAMAARYLGATPVFVDIELDTLCMDPARFKAAITPKTKAVIPVHLYGSTADLDAIGAIADEHDIAVIEDCAHGHGGKYNGKGLGSHGAVGSFSFQESKSMASGEGGICITNDSALAEKLHRLKHIGYALNQEQGAHEGAPPVGLVCYNFRGTEFQAAILTDQLAHHADLIKRYNQSAAQLAQRLGSHDAISVQKPGRCADPQSYYGLGLTFDQGLLTAAGGLGRLLEAINAEGVGGFVGGTYGPVYQHSLFNLPKEDYRIDGGTCPVSEGAGTGQTGVIAHQKLGAEPQVIDMMADVILKVVDQAATLAQ